MGDELLELARTLVRIPTAGEPGGERRAAEHVAAFLYGTGVEAQIQPVPGDRANLIARLRGTGQRPTLVLSGHLDTVPVGADRWSVPPLGAEVHDGRLFGRGASDMKGAIAAMAVALRDLATADTPPAGDVVLALTAGEEVDSCGARTLVASGLVEDAGMLVVGEMTDLHVGCAHKGLLWLRLDTDGRRGHGAMVGRDGNAIAQLVDVLHELGDGEDLVGGEHPLLGQGTVSVNQVAGGDAPNVVPAAACAVVDVRTLPHHDHAAVLAAVRARGARARVSVLREGGPVATAPDDALVQAARAAVGRELGGEAVVRGLPYLTDASVFVEGRELPTIILGPGEQAQAHSVDESVEVAALERAARIYRDIADRLLAA